jgi:thioredoxin 1
MCNMRISTILFFGFLGLFALASCARKGDDAADKSRSVPAAKNNVTSAAQVTFFELGSVNCIPCRMMQPVMKQIDSIYAGKVKVVFIDVMTDQGRPAAEQFGIKAIPTQVFQDAQGKELARHIGFYPKDSIVALLTSKGVK